MEHKITVVREDGIKNGYYWPAAFMERPCVAVIDGVPLKTKSGNLRRFADGTAARKAAMKFLAEVAK